MFLLLLRKLWIRRRRSDSEKASNSTAAIQGFEVQKRELQILENSMTTTPLYDETEMADEQIAALSTSVSHTTSNNILPSTTATQSETQPATPQPQPEQLAEEESFYHLRSLITISCLPESKYGHAPTPSVSTLGSKSGKRKSQIFDRRSASSILSLHLGDIPNLPFPSKRKVSSKTGPRYSPLPPPFVQKTLAIRPEVRF
ncbi:hypothetical protein N7475_005862 [Penicillium sp. IBT 31633x]|nr:hypothetical protein N7475_005862 [Penicillium sp. IBT 31633x]